MASLAADGITCGRWYHLPDDESDDDGDENDDDGDDNSLRGSRTD